MSRVRRALERSLRSPRADASIRELSGGEEILRARNLVRALLESLGRSASDRIASLEGYHDLSRRGDASTLLASELIHPPVEILRRAIDREQLHLARELVESEIIVSRIELALPVTSLGRTLRHALGALLALLAHAEIDASVHIVRPARPARDLDPGLFAARRVETVGDLTALLAEPPIASADFDRATPRTTARAHSRPAGTWRVLGEIPEDPAPESVAREGLAGVVAVDRHRAVVSTARLEARAPVPRARP